MTLVELLMSLVVLALGVLGIAALFPLGSRAGTDGRLTTQATDLGLQTMERLRAKGYADPDLDPGMHPSAGGEWVGTGNRLLRWWTVTQLTGSLADIKQVEIQVTWIAPRPDTVRLVTFFKR